MRVCDGVTVSSGMYTRAGGRGVSARDREEGGGGPRLAAPGVSQASLREIISLPLPSALSGPSFSVNSPSRPQLCPGAAHGRRFRGGGHRGCLALHSHVHRKPSCNLLNLKGDAKGQGGACGLLGGGGHGVTDGRAVVLWFQAEIVRGRGGQLGLRGSYVF